MALWGHTSGTESKPNWLSDADKTNTSAKPHGWELKKVVGSRTLTEVLVAWSSSGLTTAFGALSEQIQQYVLSTQTITNDIDSKLGSAVAQLGGMVEDLTNALEEFRSEEQESN